MLSPSKVFSFKSEKGGNEEEEDNFSELLEANPPLDSDSEKNVIFYKQEKKPEEEEEENTQNVSLVEDVDYDDSDINIVQNVIRYNKKGVTYRYLGDIKPSDFTSPAVAKRSWELVKKTMLKKKRQIYMLRQSNRKSRKRLDTLCSLIKRLNDNRAMKSTILKMSAGQAERSTEPPALVPVSHKREQSPLAALESHPDSLKESVKEIQKQDILVCGSCHNVFYYIDELREHKLSPENCIENTNLKETLKEEKKPQIWAFTLWKNTKCRQTVKDDKAITSWTIYQLWRNLDAHTKDAWLTAGENIQALSEIASRFPTFKFPTTHIKSEVMDEDVNTQDTNQILKQVQMNNKLTILKKQQKNTRKASRSGEDPQMEYLVEKITSKRYNPRRKTFEYYIKWEGFDTSRNTWEPASNLQNCRGLLEDFEKLVVKQKEKQKLDKNLAKEIEKSKNIINSKDGSRPQRTSKQKALSQVKQWVGNMESEEASGKRIFSDDSEEDEAYERRMNEDYSSDSENETSNMVTIKRLSKSHNGLDRKKIDLPDNILIPDSKGIVRINQKQLPALSSGVYVMSKTAGIIKLDTQTSKLATSGGQTVLKVAPKIGQTSIKVIKNGTTTTTKSANVIKQKPQIVRNYGKMFMQKKNLGHSAEAKKTLPPEPPKDPSWDDEESDGIEELEFPTDIPILPSSNSPPPEFSLCPLTGRVVDKDGQPIDPEPEIEKDDSSNIDNTAALDNLVNMAAADILEDLEPTAKRIKIETNRDSEDEDSSLLNANNSTEEIIIPEKIEPTPRSTSELPKSTDSILSTALTNANIGVRRKSTSAPGPTMLNRNPGVKHILNRSLPQPRPTPQAIITRVNPGPGMHRTRVEAPRPREQVVRKRFIHSSGNPPGNNRPTFKKTMETKVYTPKHSQVQQVQQVNTFVATPTRTPTVISMPSLIDSEPPPLVLSSGKPMVEKETHVVTSNQVVSTTTEDSEAVTEESAQADLNSLALGDSDTPLLITGEDGTIYQVAGQNEDGQTILITQNDDGEQQCLLVAPENAGIISQVLMKSGEQTVVETQEESEVQAKQDECEEPAIDSTAGEEGSSEATGMEVDDAADDSQVVAQIISANPPSPGGTRKVVLMLPDGNFMMTEVTAEQYAALELDK